MTLVATALAVSTGRGIGAGWVTAAVLAGQVSVGWSNDYLDRGRDRTSGRADKPLARGAVPPEVIGAAALTALILAVPLSLASGLTAGLTHIAAVAAAWAYNLRLKSTVISIAPYVVAFGLLPAFVVLGLPGHPAPPAWLVAGGALLGAGAHLTNVLPDLDDDLRAGIRGLPHRLGPVRSRQLAAGLLLAASAVLAVAPRGPVGLLGTVGLLAAAVIVLLGILTARRPGSRAAFRVTLAVAVLDVALLVARASTLD